MVNQQVMLSTVMCALLFSCASVASTQFSPQKLASQNTVLLSTDGSADSDLALIAAIDSAMFNGISESNAVAEFAMQVSGFQHESGGNMSSGTNRAGVDAGYLPRIDSEKHRLDTHNANINSVSFNDTGTLLLVTLGFGALAISRRRIKLAHHACAQVRSAAAPAGDTEQPSTIDQHSNSTAAKTDRNPYPELAQSVHELEALAHEMKHLS